MMNNKEMSIFPEIDFFRFQLFNIKKKYIYIINSLFFFRNLNAQLLSKYPDISHNLPL